MEFISHSVLTSQDWNPPQDLISHERLAERLLSAVSQLEPGAVVSLEADWGRGKTDVLSRIWKQTEEHPSFDTRPIWLNPWAHRDRNLLTPVVEQLLEQVPQNQRDQKVARYAGDVVAAGMAVGIAALQGVVDPGLADGMARTSLVIPQLIRRYFQDPDLQKEILAEGFQASRGAESFANLVHSVLPQERQAAGARLLILVDDLDRCLPDEQVELLREIRFVLTARRAASVILAVDPTSLGSALRATYKNENFRASPYLDKLFHLRVRMRAVSPRESKALIEGHLQRPRRLSSGQETTLLSMLSDWVGISTSHAANAAAQVLVNPQFANPRWARRVTDTLLMVVLARPFLDADLQEKADTIKLLLIYVILGLKYPSIRRIYQSFSQDDFEQAYQAVWEACCDAGAQTPDSDVRRSVLTLLDLSDSEKRDAAPLIRLLGREHRGRKVYHLEAALSQTGV